MIFLASFHTIARLRLSREYSYLVDLVSATFLLLGTHCRADILNQNQKTNSAEAIAEYFVFSLVSWVAAVILEAQTCILIFDKAKQVTRPFRLEESVWYWLKAITMELFALNSIAVVSFFSKDVSHSVLRLTSDHAPWLIDYHRAAALFKILSAAFQGRYHFTISRMLKGRLKLELNYYSPF